MQNFIQQEQAEYKEIQCMCGAYLDLSDNIQSHDNRLLARVVEMAEKAEKIEASKPLMEIRGDSYRRGYNQALDDIIKELKQDNS